MQPKCVLRCFIYKRTTLCDKGERAMKVSAEAEELFSRRVDEYSDMVTRICFLRTGNREDAEDCWQNVFLKLYRSSMIEASPEDLKPWLIRVTVNECKNFLRSLSRRKAVPIDDCVIPVEDSR